MPLTIKNPAGVDLSDLETHVVDMYDYFDDKFGFSKPPSVVFDSDATNQSKVLGKTAYYDPSSLEIHVYSDGRHPKDMLRSIAHELIHHRQNLEGRLNVGGYHGEGYYLENEELKNLEHEAMLEGNAVMREYEDTLKRKENKEMSLNEWKNNELNRLLMKKFGILTEDTTGFTPVKDDETDKKKDATYKGHYKADAPGVVSEDSGEEESHHDWDNEHADDDHIREIERHLDALRKDRNYERDRVDESNLTEDSGEEEKRHYEDNAWNDEDHIEAIEKHLKALKKDKDYDEDHEELEETVSSRKDPRNRKSDENTNLRPMEENNPAGSLEASEEAGDDSDPIDAMLENKIRKVLKRNKKLKLRFK